MDKMRIEIIPSIEMDLDLKESIRVWLVSEFIVDDDITVWSDADWHILGWMDKELISHLDVLNREVLIDGMKVCIAGIGGVVTKAGWRGKGIASKLMRETHHYLTEEVNVEFGLLMCDKKRVTFYRDLGWKLVENQLVYAQPSGKVVFADCVMAYPLRLNEFPPGKIDVQGCPW